MDGSHLLTPPCFPECLIREVKLGSFTALLHGGVQMSYSFYGPTGESSGLHPEHAAGHTGGGERLQTGV